MTTANESSRYSAMVERVAAVPSLTLEDAKLLGAAARLELGTDSRFLSEDGALVAVIKLAELLERYATDSGSGDQATSDHTSQPPSPDEEHVEFRREVEALVAALEAPAGVAEATARMRAWGMGWGAIDDWWRSPNPWLLDDASPLEVALAGDMDAVRRALDGLMQ